MRIRRLAFDHKPAFPAPANPFNTFQRYFPAFRPLKVGLHTASLQNLENTGRFIVEELVASHRRKVVQPFRTPGSLNFLWPDVPDFEVDEFDDRLIIKFGARRDYEFSSLRDVGQIRSLLGSWLGDPEKENQFLLLLAVNELGADLIVTADPGLIELREQPIFRALNLVSPYEAFPLIGVYSRAVGESFLAGPVGASDWYSWVLARGITPAAWPGFSALVHGQRFFEEGRKLLDYGQSILRRLADCIDRLDRMILAWQQDDQRHVGDEFDAVILAISAIQDNLALLAGKFLGIRLAAPYEWTLLNKKWRNKINSTGQRGMRVVSSVQQFTPCLQITRELRHHAVHREPLSGIRGGRGDFHFEISGDVWRCLKEAVSDMNEAPAQWGFSNQQKARHIEVVSIVDDTTTERHKEFADESAYLDPVPFAVRAVAMVGVLVNRIFSDLEPAMDSRLPPDVARRVLKSADKAATHRGSDMFSRENTMAALLSSPLSGLV